MTTSKTQSGNRRNIAPGDEAWYVPEKCKPWLNSAVAFSRERFIFLMAWEDEWDTIENATRIYRYHGSWWDLIIAKIKFDDVVEWHPSTWTNSGVALLSTDNKKVYFLGETTSEEDIVSDPQRVIARDIGLSSLYNFKGNLIAFGHNGQLYRRGDQGWSSDDKGLYGLKKESKSFWVFDISIDDKGGTYACGAYGNEIPALFYQKPGEDWQELQIPYGEIKSGKEYVRIMGVSFFEGNGCYLVTSNRIILKGDWLVGFQIVARLPSESGKYFESIVKYKSDIYVGGEHGVYRLVEGVLQVQTGPLYIDANGIETSKISGYILQVVDDMLWAFGSEMDISRFDGKAWERIPVPSLYRTEK